jgi:two-component system heavy metal sensor histidine kinase CusS
MRSWSIRGWLTRWLALTSIGSILALAGFSDWFLRASVARELDSLAHEEVDEMMALFAATGGSPEEFDAIAADLQASHPENRLAWRVWAPDGTRWHESGARDLLEAAEPRPEPLASNQRVRGSLRWRTEALGDGRRIGVAVDGSAQYAMLARFEAFGMALVLGAASCAWSIAAFLSRRTSMLLHVVADAARAGGEPGLESARRVALPEEIRAVADALGATLARIGSEQERAQLMTSGLAHELRSPIQNLLGEAEVALMRERVPGEYREVLQRQVEELRDLGRSVDNLVLLCSRDEPTAVETFDLGDEATLRLDRDSLRAARTGVRVEFELDGDLTVRGDREALVLALRNLVTNAVAWSPEGGLVRVALSGTDHAVEVTVDDQGPGIPPEQVERIFEPFHRGPQAGGRRVGFGLGLALARSAVAMHGGEIHAERSPDGGARLRFVLPRARGAASALPAPEQAVLSLK